MFIFGKKSKTGNYIAEGVTDGVRSPKVAMISNTWLVVVSQFSHY